LFSTLSAQLSNSSFVQKVNSTGNKVYIAFNSGFNIEGRGFKATYSSYKKGKTKIGRSHAEKFLKVIEFIFFLNFQEFRKENQDIGKWN
jgi:hypothetical protein